MKQGQASTSLVGSTKQEPVSRAVNVSTVSEIGCAVGRNPSVNLYEGRGLEAPMKSTTIHNSGSQGKHR